MTLEIGQTVSRYRIVDKLGEGGMGVVYKAHDAQLNRHVAVKVLPREVAGNRERLLRFQREAQAAAALNHPNIGTIHEAGEHDGNPYLVMEWIDGETLRARMGHRPLTMKDWFRIGIPIADGLDHAHKNGIVHRDLKPDNVMITGENQVKILDFGLAKLVEPEALEHETARDLHSRLDTISQELTRAGKVFGTVAYMSPEQARGEAVDHRSDLFSYGVLLYQMASGQAPFKKETQVETLAAIIKESPPPLTELSGEIPIEAERVVRKALEKEPERRYQHADEMATDLRNLRRDLDSDRITLTTGTVPRAGSGPKTGLWIGGAVAIVAIALAGFLFLGRGTTTGPTPTVTTADSNPAIGVVGFENLSDPGDADNLGRILAGLITTDLAETGGLRIVSTPKILHALQQVTGPEADGFHLITATEAARAAGVDIMVVGQLTRIGERMNLTAELVEVGSGDTVGSFRSAAGSSAGLFDLAAGIADQVRSTIGTAGIGSSSSFDLAQALTASPQAYRYYTQGETLLQQGIFDEAVTDFRRAIDADPTFALAYFRFGIAAWWGQDHPGAIATLEEGLEQIHRLPPRWQTLYRALLDWMQGRQVPAYNALVELLRDHRDIPEAYYIAGELAFHTPAVLDFARAREYLEEAFEIDPTFHIGFQHLMTIYMAEENVAGMENLINRVRATGFDDPLFDLVSTFLLTAQTDYDAALAMTEKWTDRDLEYLLSAVGAIEINAGEPERVYERTSRALERGDRKFDQWVHYFHGLAAAQLGRLELGITSLRESVDRDETLVSRGWLELNGFARLLDTVFLRGLTGDTATAISELAEWTGHPKSAALGRHYLGWLHLRAGDEAAARSVLDWLEENLDTWPSNNARVQAGLLRAELLIREGKGAEAVREIDALSDYSLGEYADIILFVRARAEAASGDTESALETFRRLHESSNAWSGWILIDTFSYYHLGRLHEEIGNPGEAIRNYRRILEHWGDADLKIPEVEEARDRLARLEAR